MKRISAVKNPRTVALLLALLTVAAIALLGAPHALAAGSPNLTLQASIPQNVLYGTPATVSLTAGNPAGQPYGYNLSFSDVLPNGVSYVPGSAAFAGAGAEPQVIANAPAVGETTLIWSNLSDLSPGSSQTLTYQVAHATGVYDVGSSYTETPAAYISANPRYIPKFNSNGSPNGPSATSFTGEATATGQTNITAVQITQLGTGKLLRGVHDHQYVYTLKIENNHVNPTDTPVVDEYLPAGLEFLGCGNVDNTTDAPTNPNQTEEWPGSGPLTGHTPSPANCVTPSLVETVTAAPDGLPSGVYTHIQWSGGQTLAPSEVRYITFVTAVPIRENTLTWAPGTTPPTPQSLGQAANLDNNSGAETYHNEPLPSDATIGGDYNDRLPVSDANQATSVAKDIIVAKSVDKALIGVGDIDHFTLTATTGEYRYFDAVNLTDTLPDGLCPVDASDATLSAQCAPSSPSDTPSSPYTTASENPDGTWTMTFDDTTFPAFTQMLPNTAQTITYPVRVNAYYQRNGTNTTPVLAEDAWSNGIAVAGTEHVRCTQTDSNCTNPFPFKIDHDEADADIRTDTASAGQSAPGPSIAKTVRVADTSHPVNCTTGTYVTGTATDYSPGDRICFTLHVTFPDGVYTGSPQVTDFLPQGTTYEPGSYQLTAANSVNVQSFSSSTPGVLTFTLGAAAANAVAPGQTFDAIVAVEVTDPALQSDADIVGNLMKFSNTNTAGTTFPQRALANFTYTEADLSLLEGVQSVNGQPSPVYGPNHDGVKVSAGDSATIRVDVTNSGSDNATDATVWDNIPSQLTCASVNAISAGGTCSGGRITWTGVNTAAGAETTLNYSYVVPASAQPATVYTSHAGVVSYQSADNFGQQFTYVPANNIDANVATDVGPVNATAADDPTDTYTGTPTLAVTRTTNLTDAGNTSAQATVGERVDYTVTLTLPAGTTVNGNADALLQDAVGSRQTYAPGSLAVTYDGSVTLPAGVSTSDASGLMSVDFPAGYTVPANQTQTYVMTFSAYVNDQANNTKATPNNSLPDAATFAYDASTATTPTTLTDSVATTLVEPNIKLAKTDNAAGHVNPGQTVLYTVTESNPSPPGGVSTAYNNTIVDTLPVGLVPLDSSGSPVADGGVVAPGTGVWSASARTITFTASSLAPNATAAFTYNALVPAPQAADAAYTNTAVATATSTPSAPPTPGTQRTATSAAAESVPGYQAAAVDTVRNPDSVLAKAVSAPTQTIGGDETYTLRVTIPGGVYSYDNTILDTLPDGMVYGAEQSAACTSGCAQNPVAVTEIPHQANADGTTTLGFYLGAIAANPVGQARTVTITYSAHVAAVNHSAQSILAGASLQNTAVLYDNPSETGSGNPPASIPATSGFANASAQQHATVTVIEPNLTIVKHVNGQAAISGQPGQTLTYTVAVSNTGTAAADDVTISDAPNAKLTDVQTAAGDSTNDITQAWTAPGSSMTWQVPSIAAGATETLTYSATLQSSGGLHATDVASNTASVPSYWGVPAAQRAADGFTYRHYTPDPTSTATVTVALPQIGVNLTTGALGLPKSANAEVGQPFAWQATLTNTSPVADAKDANLTVTLPVNWSYTPGSTVGGPEPAVTGTPAGGETLTWTDVADLPHGASHVVTFDATPLLGAETTPGTGAAHPNIAAASDSATDDSGASGSADGPYAAGPSDAQGILQVPVLTILKTPKNGQATAGARATWTVLVSNTAVSASARNVTVTDDMPAGVSYATGAASSPADANFSEASVDRSGAAPVITWTLGTIAPGGSVSITVPVTVSSSLSSGTVLQNAASVISAELVTPVTDTGSFVVATSADVSLAKSANTAKVIAGGQLQYTLVASNNGPSDAQNVRLSDNLPAGETFASFAQGSNVCSNSGNDISCNFGTMSPGSAQTVLVNVNVAGATLGNVTNTATATSDTPDPNLSNNTSSVTTEVDASADVSLVKTVSPAIVEVGHPATYTLTASNAGASTAQNVTVSDPLPAGETFASASAGCTSTASTVTCALGALAAGQSASATITVTATTVGVLTNTATATSATPDPNPVNNTASASLQVVASTTFTLSKTVTCGCDKDPVKVGRLTAGGTAKFTITARNTGAHAGYDVSVCDDLDGNWSLVSAPGAVTGQPCWQVAVFPAHSTKTFRVTARLNLDATGTAVNHAVLNSANSPDYGASASVKVIASSGSPRGDWVTVVKHEQYVSMTPGQTQTQSVSCPDGGILSDGTPEVVEVDQGTGTLASVHVLAAYSTGPSSFAFVLDNTATGDAQVELYATCMPAQTAGHNLALHVSAPVTKTVSWAPGDHTQTLQCASGQEPIDPGYDITSGYGTLNYSEPTASGGWTIGFAADSPMTATVSVRCLSIKVGSGAQTLVFSHPVVTVTVAPGQMQTAEVICDQQADGIVASSDLPDGLLLLGDDPQPKTRVFHLYNPTGAPLTATLDLICVGDRTTTVPKAAPCPKKTHTARTPARKHKHTTKKPKHGTKTHRR